MTAPTRIAILIAIASNLASPCALASASLALVDGRIIDGVDVELKGDFYQLEIADGSLVAIPYELVSAIKLTEEGETRASDAASEPPAPSGLRTAEAKTLAGPAMDLPRPDDQLRVLGPPARFRPGPVTTMLSPSYWTLDPTQNDFNPASWAQNVVRPDWQPVSAFDGRKDVLSPGRSTWRRNLIGSAWVPVDGFNSRQR